MTARTPSAAGTIALDAFETVGGLHTPFAALCDALAHADVVSPHTRKPFDESMLFGLAGGICAGHALSPPIKGYGAKRGFTFIGRAGLGVPGPGLLVGLLKLLATRPLVRETAGRQAALDHVVAALRSGRPALVWCAPPRVAASPWAGTCGSYVLLVHGIDLRGGSVHWSDRARTSLRMTPREFAALRGAVKVHRQRVLTFAPDRRLTLAALREALRSAIRTTARTLLDPKSSGHGVGGLLSLARMIPSITNAHGWPRLYPGGRLFVALRDLHESVETAGTGGGLYRASYADFLDVTAGLTRNRALRGSAKSYRQLAEDWSALADEALPSRISAFRSAKQLLARREREFLRGGPRVREHVDKTSGELAALAARLNTRFPLDRTASMELLTGLSERITELHTAEEHAARALLKAVR